MLYATQVAEQLVSYDERVATRILAALCAELGGPTATGHPDLTRMKAFLGQPDARALAETDDPQTTTAEWKADFGHYEATRSLAGALAALLDR